jgi:NAD(P)-dependent dehydrogenase (short-subunit alcohol dehydrogenase family)
VYEEIIAAGGPEPAMFPFDLAAADDRGLETLAGTIAHHLKRLDGVLHSAHKFYTLTPLELETLEQWQTLMRVNLIAPFALTRACLPLLRQAPMLRWYSPARPTATSPAHTGAAMQWRNRAWKRSPASGPTSSAPRKTCASTP